LGSHAHLLRRVSTTSCILVLELDISTGVFFAVAFPVRIIRTNFRVISVVAIRRATEVVAVTKIRWGTWDVRKH
jgi:hypothetical protein